MRRIPSSGFLEPLSPSRGAFSPVSSVSWDPTQALVRRSQSVGSETLQAPPSPRTLLDDLLVTHTQLEVQSHAALALEDVAELKATRAHLEERLADLKYKVSLQQRIRSATTALRNSRWAASQNGPSSDEVHENADVAQAMERADAAMQEYMELAHEVHSIETQLLGHHIAVLRDHLMQNKPQQHNTLAGGVHTALQRAAHTAADQERRVQELEEKHEQTRDAHVSLQRELHEAQKQKQHLDEKHARTTRELAAEQESRKTLLASLESVLQDAATSLVQDLDDTPRVIEAPQADPIADRMAHAAEQFRSQHQSLRRALADEQAAHDALKQKWQDANDHLDTTTTEFEKALGGRVEANHTLESEVKTLRTQLQEAQEDVQEARAALEAEQDEAQEARVALAKAMSDAEAARDELAKAQAETSRLETALAQAQSESDTHRTAREVAEAESEKHASALAEARQHVDDHRAAREMAEAESGVHAAALAEAQQESETHRTAREAAEAQSKEHAAALARAAQQHAAELAAAQAKLQETFEHSIAQSRSAPTSLDETNEAHEARLQAEHEESRLLEIQLHGEPAEPESIVGEPDVAVQDVPTGSATLSVPGDEKRSLSDRLSDTLHSSPGAALSPGSAQSWGSTSPSSRRTSAAWTRPRRTKPTDVSGVEAANDALLLHSELETEREQRAALQKQLDELHAQHAHVTATLEQAQAALEQQAKRGESRPPSNDVMAPASAPAMPALATKAAPGTNGLAQDASALVATPELPSQGTESAQDVESAQGAERAEVPENIRDPERAQGAEHAQDPESTRDAAPTQGAAASPRPISTPALAANIPLPNTPTVPEPTARAARGFGLGLNIPSHASQPTAPSNPLVSSASTDAKHAPEASAPVDEARAPELASPWQTRRRVLDGAPTLAPSESSPATRGLGLSTSMTSPSYPLRSAPLPGDDLRSPYSHISRDSWDSQTHGPLLSAGMSPRGSDGQIRGRDARTRLLEVQVDKHRRAAEQSRAAYEELKAKYDAEHDLGAQQQAVARTWAEEWKRFSERLEQQDKFCARVLGKDDGREEMDELLNQIKASSYTRPAPAAALVEQSQAAVDEFDKLISKLEEHISDMAEGLASAGTSGLGSNVMAQLEDQIEDLQEQLQARDAELAATAAGEGAGSASALLARARAAEEQLAVCLYSLALVSALLPPEDALAHSMSLPLTAVHALFAATQPGTPSALEAVRAAYGTAFDSAVHMLLASGDTPRAASPAFAHRVDAVLASLPSELRPAISALLADVFSRLIATMNTSEMVTERAIVLEESVQRYVDSAPVTPMPDAGVMADPDVE